MFTKYEEFNVAYHNAVSARGEYFKYRREDEEYYYADIEGTRTQFTKKQLNAIKAKYDIPISTKIGYALIEQIVSFVSGTKPYPKFIAETDSISDYASLFERMHNALWYESKANEAVDAAIRDMLICGCGWTRVRKNNFYAESTFNTVIEYVPWTDVLVDPSSRKRDFSDAGWMIVAEVMPVHKAEKLYDVKIPDNTDDTTLIFPYSTDDVNIGENHVWNGDNRKLRYTVIREFYEKDLVRVYMDEKGNLSNKKPEPTEVPNPALEPLMMQREEIKAQYEQLANQLMQAEAERQQAVDGLATSTNAALDIENEETSTLNSDEVKAQVGQIEKQLQEIDIVIQQTPQTVPAFKFIKLEREEETIAYEVTTKKTKRIIRTLYVHDQKVEREVLSTDEFPLIPFVFTHMRSERRIYGMMHMIRDFVDALNKFWGLMILNAQTNGNPKWMAAKGAIEDMEKWENSGSMPGSVLEYVPNEALQGRDIPTPVQGQPLTPAHVELIKMLVNLCEYISGIHGIVQGNTESAPNSLGGIHSMLSFGTQRVKSYGRIIENALQKQAYITAQVLHTHAPRNTVVKYFDDNNDQKEIEILDMPEDLKFRVRVMLTTNMPTSRNMAAMILSTLAGQTGSPEIQSLLTEYALEMIDLPQGTEMREKIDVVKQLQSQIDQIQKELQFKDSQLRALENNMSQKEIASKQKEAEMALEYETEKQIEQMGQEEEQFNNINLGL